MIKNFPTITSVPKKYKSFLRDKAISRARTRIIIAGKQPSDFSEDDLEIIVREEEDKLKNAIKQRGLLAVLALFGIHVFG